MFESKKELVEFIESEFNEKDFDVFLNFIENEFDNSCLENPLVFFETKFEAFIPIVKEKTNKFFIAEHIYNESKKTKSFRELEPERTVFLSLQKEFFENQNKLVLLSELKKKLNRFNNKNKFIGIENIPLDKLEDRDVLTSFEKDIDIIYNNCIDTKTKFGKISSSEINDHIRKRYNNSYFKKKDRKSYTNAIYGKLQEMNKDIFKYKEEVVYKS